MINLKPRRSTRRTKLGYYSYDFALSDGSTIGVFAKNKKKAINKVIRWQNSVFNRDKVKVI